MTCTCAYFERDDMMLEEAQTAKLDLAPPTEDVLEFSSAASSSVTQVQQLSPHHVRTLDTWAATLVARHDEAVADASEEVYQHYLRYLTGCADVLPARYHRSCAITLATG